METPSARILGLSLLNNQDIFPHHVVILVARNQETQPSAAKGVQGRTRVL